MIDREIDIATADGPMNTFITHPEEGGPFPVVLFYMDAPGKREELHEMARRLGSVGYYVMVPNLYYRRVREFVMTADLRAEMMAHMNSLSNQMVCEDSAALLTFADGEAAASDGAVGCVGYCMSGPFALWAAAEHADVVRAAASFYGVRLHVDADDSPHTRLGDVSGELYVGAAEHDDYVPLDMVDRLEAAMQDTDVAGRVERYWGTHHGFAFDDRPAYDRRADDRHWAAMLDLFERTLQS